MTASSGKDRSRRRGLLERIVPDRTTPKAEDPPPVMPGLYHGRWPWLTIASRGSVRDLPVAALSAVTRTVEIADEAELAAAAPDLLLLEAPSQGGPLQLSDSDVLPLLLHCEQHAVATVIFAATDHDAAGPLAHTSRVVASVHPEVSAIAVDQVGPERATAMPVIADTWAAHPVPRGRQRRSTTIVVGQAPVPGSYGPVLGAEVEFASVEPDWLHLHPDRIEAAIERAGVAVAASPSPTLEDQRMMVALAAHGLPIVAADGPAPLAEGLTIAPGEDPFVTSRRLLEDERRHEVAAITAHRAALLHHGADRALEMILGAAGIPPRPTFSVSLLAPVTDPSLLGRLRDNVVRQHHQRLELVLTTPERHLERVRAEVRGWELATEVAGMPGAARRGDHLNVAAAIAGGEFLAPIDPRAVYGPFHVTDLLLALRHARADLVGKLERFVYDPTADATVRLEEGAGEGAHGRVAAGTVLLPRELALGSGFSRRASTPDARLARRVDSDGGSVYAVHPFDTLLPGTLPEGDDRAEGATPGEDVGRALPFGDGGVPVVTLHDR